MSSKGNQGVFGKPEIVRALQEEGFHREEASRAYEVLLDAIERALRSGRILYFRRIFKVWSQLMPPRRRWDNWHKKHIYFGERIELRIKPFFLKERNLTGRKIKAGPKPKKPKPLKPKRSRSAASRVIPVREGHHVQQKSHRVHGTRRTQKRDRG